MFWKETSQFRDGQEVCKGCQEIYCCGCGLSKAPGLFSVKARDHYFHSSQQVACEECIAKGVKATYAPFRKDAKCTECERELPNNRFRTIKKQRQTKCKDCEVVCCKACGQERRGTNFDEQTKKHYLSHGQAAVCDVCKSKQLYRCTTCNEQWDSSKFSKDDLKSYARSSQGAAELLCSGCSDAVLLKEREVMKKWNTCKKKSCRCPGTIHEDQCFMKWHGNGPRPYYGEDVLERHEAEWLEERKRLKKKRKA